MRFVSRCFGENVAWFCQPARTFWSFVNRDDSDDQPEEEQNSQSLVNIYRVKQHSSFPHYTVQK